MEKDVQEELRLLRSEVASLNEKISLTIQIQANSLSVPLLKDVIIPLVLRFFIFFSGIVLLLISGVLGIKYVAKDVLQITGM